MGITSAELDKHSRQETPQHQDPQPNSTLACSHVSSTSQLRKFQWPREGKPQVCILQTVQDSASCLTGAALMMTLSLNGNLLFREIHIFLPDESDKSTSGKKLLQTSNHSTPTINVAGERHSMMDKFAFQGCIAAFLLFSLAQGMCNKLSSPVQ